MQACRDDCQCAAKLPIMYALRIADLPAPVTTAKADWLVSSHWLGFTPASDAPWAASQCQAAINRQIAGGYVLEYITQRFGKPNAGYEDDPTYRKERRMHAEVAGRLIAVHRIRPTMRPLRTIIGSEDFERIQDMWSENGMRHRWSVAFPIVESYSIPTKPLANELLGSDAMRRVFGHPSATLRPLNNDERQAIADLPLLPRNTANAWIGIEDEITMAERSPVDATIIRDIDRDLGLAALEGFTEAQWAGIRRRAAWLAHMFVRKRQRAGKLLCDQCHFDPTKHPNCASIKPRSLLDVHHRRPLKEGRRVTTLDDFALLCPTCHRIEHRLQRSSAAQ